MTVKTKHLVAIDKFMEKANEGPAALKDWLEQDVDNMIAAIVAVVYKIATMEAQEIHLLDVTELVTQLETQNDN